jgi:hypothetical protein
MKRLVTSFCLERTATQMKKNTHIVISSFNMKPFTVQRNYDAERVYSIAKKVINIISDKKKHFTYFFI